MVPFGEVTRDKEREVEVEGLNVNVWWINLILGSKIREMILGYLKGIKASI